MRAVTTHLADYLTQQLLPPGPRERELHARLRDDLSQLQVIDTSGMSGAEAAWAGFMNRLRELGCGHDPRQFLRWDVIKRTMLVRKAAYLDNELAELRALPEWPTRWRPAIVESSLGRPIRHRTHPESSGNLIHHAYHAARFQSQMGMPVEAHDLVIEFGGGYGSMCRLIHNLGFGGRYLIFDLPHFSALQRYFLAGIGVTVRDAESFSETGDGVFLVSDISQLEAMLHTVPAHSLFLATWSLSETPLAIREPVANLLDRFSAFLFAYQDRFEDVDNVAWFATLENRLEQVKWFRQVIGHIPGNRYLFGCR